MTSTLQRRLGYVDIVSVKADHVTKTVSVTAAIPEPISVTVFSCPPAKRGRPKKETALSPAEKQRAYRERKKAR